MHRLALLALTVTAAAAPVTRTVTQRAWCPPGWTVVVSHRYGNVMATGEQGRDSLSVEARVRVDGSDRRAGEEFARDVGLSLASWAETLYVNVLYPDLPEPSSELSYDVDLSLSMPARARLDATSSFGDFAARGLAAGCRVEHSFGNVLLVGCRDSRVVNRHGDVEVNESDGGLLVNSSYGNVYLDGVQSNARVDNCYGNVEGTHLDGDVVLANVMGRVVARDSRGQLLLVNRYGEVEAWVEDSALANLDVQAELSRVRLNLARTMPYRLGGRVVQGAVQTGLPVVVREHGPERTISGQSGQGGPRIMLVGSWADFIIVPDSTGDSTAVPQTDRGDERR